MIALALRCEAEGIQSLVAVGKSMADAKKTLAADDAAYANVKRAADSGALAKGRSKSEIRSQYGEPVVINEDLATKRERWVYKPNSSSFFKGERICLYFDTAGNLDEIKKLQ